MRNVRPTPTMNWLLILKADNGRTGFPWARNGVCKPPAWKQDGLFVDVDGNTRPNWARYYWLLGSGRNCTYDSSAGRFIFYIGGKTFAYDPSGRTWKELTPPVDPQNSTPLKTKLLWGSICCDEANKQLVLFGGGNSDTERGDPGTWTYSLAHNTWTQLKLDKQPPPRANSQLAYDPINKKIVLFGGDQFDQVISDTWTFDGKQWEQKKPSSVPAPRGGHALLWMPKAKKLLMLGGYTVSSEVGYMTTPYKSLPFEAWTYDVNSDKWTLVKRFETAKNIPASPCNRFLMAAIDSDDQVAVVDERRKLWLCNIDASAFDAIGTASFGVNPGAIERRGGQYDPAWYTQDSPADPAKVESELNTLPVNQWVLRPTPKRPAPNVDWGTAAFDTDHDKIIRFSGGHSSYSGTAPHIYDVKIDRYTIPFAPEMPAEFIFSNDQVVGEWSFKGNPWMTGHTYKSTGYDPILKCFVFAPHNYTFFFNTAENKWTRNTQICPFRPDFYTVTLATTPKGVVAWALRRGSGESGLWRLKADDRTWQPLPQKGSLFKPEADNTGMAYDSKRDALFFFRRNGKGGCYVNSYTFASGEATTLTPVGSDKIQSNFREAVYLPEADVIMISTFGQFYDCAKSAWVKTNLATVPELKNSAGHDLGVVYDPVRRLVWVMNADNQVFVLKFDAKKTTWEEVK